MQTVIFLKLMNHLHIKMNILHPSMVYVNIIRKCDSTSMEIVVKFDYLLREFHVTYKFYQNQLLL